MYNLKVIKTPEVDDKYIFIVATEDLSRNINNKFSRIRHKAWGYIVVTCPYATELKDILYIVVTCPTLRY